MQQIALFGNAADRFFLTLEEPPEELEMVVTEELYQVALESRLAHGEPDDYDHFDYQEQEAEGMSAKTDFDLGRRDGRNDISVLIGGKKSKDYLDGHSLGTEERRAEHRSVLPAVVWTRGMLIAADCRVIKGSFNKGN